MAIEILDYDIVPAPSGCQQGSSKEHDRLEDDLKLTGEAQNFREGTRVENERVQKGVAKRRSCSSTFMNDRGEEELKPAGSGDRRLWDLWELGFFIDFGAPQYNTL